MNAFKSLKTLSLILCTALSLWTAPALAAGTLPIAMAQQVDINGRPLAGCQVNFYVAGTVASPQNSFADFGLTQTNPQTLVCDQNGRVPMFWLADGLVHVRMIDPSGAPLIDVTMQVLGPSSGGGGGGGTVDPTTIIATGDVKVKYGTGPLSGFVRANALTIGNAGSGATERANADVQALYVYLYGADPNLVVSGGRSGNALNDFNAGKQLTMPDWRGRALAALDDMGNGAAGRLTASYFGTAATVLGAAGGLEKQNFSIANLNTFSFTPTVSAYNLTFPVAQTNTAGQKNAGEVDSNSPTGNGPIGGSITMSTITLGSGTAAAIASPMMLATIYLKL